jgi:hypothetical protein
MILAFYYGINLPKFASNNDRLSAVHLRRLYALLHLPLLVQKQECDLY